MRGPSVVAAVLLVLVGATSCRRRESARPAADAGPVAAVTSGPDAGLELSVAKLDGFLAYERLLRGEPAPSSREVRRLSQAVDGGARALEEAYAGLRRRTERAQAVRVDAGLSQTEVQALETLTAEVALARAGSGGPELEEALRSLEAAKDQLPAEQRAGVERTVVRLRAQQDRARTLSEVRARWGDEAVDVVLAREKAVLELWGVPAR
ncbi:MAG TPA: hypothetical protein VMT11_17315 [Myxococcaceae bacterium]|nr:hypothetical protein [Myxococcaceae bacterium]